MLVWYVQCKCHCFKSPLMFQNVLFQSVVVKQMLAVTAGVMALLCYTQYETDVERTKTHVGFIASLVTILFFAAPLTMLVRH